MSSEPTNTLYVKFLNGDLLQLERPIGESMQEFTEYVERTIPDCELGTLTLTLLPRTGEYNTDEIESVIQSMSDMDVHDEDIYDGAVYAAFIRNDPVSIRLSRQTDGIIEYKGSETPVERYQIEFLRGNGTPFRAYSFVYDTEDHVYTNENEYVYDDELSDETHAHLIIPQNNRVYWHNTLHDCIMNYQFDARSDPYFDAAFTPSTFAEAKRIWYEHLMRTEEARNLRMDEN